MQIADETTAINTPELAADELTLGAGETRKPTFRQMKLAKYRRQVAVKQEQSTMKLMDFLKKKIQMIRATDAEARKKANRKIATFFNYYDGNVMMLEQGCATSER